MTEGLANLLYYLSLIALLSLALFSVRLGWKILRLSLCLACVTSVSIFITLLAARSIPGASHRVPVLLITGMAALGIYVMRPPPRT